MLRSSPGTSARLLNGFKDGKLLQGVEGSSNLQLFNPMKNCFLAYALAKRNPSKRFYGYAHLQNMQCNSPHFSFRALRLQASQALKLFSTALRQDLPGVVITIGWPPRRDACLPELGI